MSLSTDWHMASSVSYLTLKSSEAIKGILNLQNDTGIAYNFAKI